MDQLRALRTFLRVVDDGSFAGAARSLDLAPAVVTRLVADLEHQLGARLLHRTTRRLTLTSTGAEYAERARRILSDLDEANAAASHATTALRGPLRIGGPLPFLQQQIAPLLPEFLARHPGLQFHFNVGCDPVVGTPDESDDLSILLRGTQPLDGDFIARRLCTSEILMCATPAYLAQHGRPLKPEDLLAHELLIPATAEVPREWELRRGAGQPEQGRRVVPPPGPARINSAHSALLLGAALSGLGIAGTLSFLVVDALRDGRLERVLPDWSIGRYTVFAAMPSRHYLPRRVKAFSDYLVEKLGGSERDPWLDAPALAEER